MFLDREPPKQIGDACRLRFGDIRQWISRRNLPPTVNVNEFCLPRAAESIKFNLFLFRARQAATAIVSPSTWRTTNALSALSFLDRGGDLRPSPGALSSKPPNQASPRPRARLSAAKPRFPTAGSTSAIATMKSAPLGKLKPMDVRLTKQSWKTLNEINNKVNNAIEPISNLDHWGTTLDHWDYPVDGKGDCKIYALFKRKLLRRPRLSAPGPADDDRSRTSMARAMRCLPSRPTTATSCSTICRMTSARGPPPATSSTSARPRTIRMCGSASAARPGPRGNGRLELRLLADDQRERYPHQLRLRARQPV